MELIKKNNKKNNKKNKKNNQHKWRSIWIGFWYKLCESEKEFDNINEIEDSDSGNKNYHNIYCKRKRMRIISYIKSKSKIKIADNEENIMKAGP